MEILLGYKASHLESVLSHLRLVRLVLASERLNYYYNHNALVARAVRLADELSLLLLLFHPTPLFTCALVSQSVS